MLKPTTAVLTTVAAALAVAFTASTMVAAQSQTDVLGALAGNEGIFIDAKSFQIAKGKAKGDPTTQMAKLGAREIGPGAILFRHNDKLYLVEGTPPAPQAMKNFQSDWAVSYMNAVKDFQDHYAVSYMKDLPGPVRENYLQAMKDFQDNWNVSYVKALKEFQDGWSVAYMKTFQDEWNVSYAKALKEFQDNWTTSYVK